MPLLLHLPPITIINVGGNVPNLYAERCLLHTLMLSDYPETRPEGYAYIISLQDMKNEKIELLKNNIYLL